MKRVTFIFSIAIFLFLYSCSLKQSAALNWKVTWTNPGAGQVRNMITENLKPDWLPVGLSSNMNKIFAFYIKAEKLKLTAKSYAVEKYDNIDSFKNTVDEKIKSYRLPIGITQTGENFWVLYVKVKNNAKGCKIIKIKNLANFNKSIESNSVKGFYPAALTDSDNSVIVLFVKHSAFSAKKWHLKAHSPKKGLFKKQVDMEISKGMLPVTFSYRRDRVYMLYLLK